MNSEGFILKLLSSPSSISSFKYNLTRAGGVSAGGASENPKPCEVEKWLEVSLCVIYIMFSKQFPSGKIDYRVVKSV